VPAKKLLWLDTDIGDDVDDALALGLAASSPELELVGVSTVFRNARERARLAWKVLEDFGAPGVPVYAGLSRPRRQPVERFRMSQGRVVGAAHRRRPVPGRGVERMVEAVLARPGRVTLVSIGPLTNVAAAITREPRFAGALKGCVAMCGVYGEQSREWNIHCDPEAAAVVFGSGLRPRVVGLDVTRRCVMSAKDLAAFRTSRRPGARLLWRLSRLWQGGRRGRRPTLHDPLAVALLLDPNLVTLCPMKVDVELRGRFTRGFTVARAAPGRGAADALVAVDVAAARFLRLFRERVAGR
jgi:inosine-uridine nucleoside N-ribohydrolase